VTGDDDLSDELRAQRPDISAADLYRFEQLRLVAADVAPELLDDPARMTRLILELMDVVRWWGPVELDAE